MSVYQRHLRTYNKISYNAVPYCQRSRYIKGTRYCMICKLQKCKKYNLHYKTTVGGGVVYIYRTTVRLLIECICSTHTSPQFFSFVLNVRKRLRQTPVKSTETANSKYPKCPKFTQKMPVTPVKSIV